MKVNPKNYKENRNNKIAINFLESGKNSSNLTKIWNEI